jgi:D-alanyl-D-alanine carboxypeptidase
MSRLRSTDDLLDWMRGHRGHVGLVVRQGDAGEQDEVCHDADGRFPLAATRTVLVLGAYAEAVARRRLDPDEAVPLPDVQRWWTRGTDGGAHLDAERDWRHRNRVLRGRVLTVPLDEVVHGMVRWSSSACADYLLDRMGTDAVHDWATRRGMVAQDAVYPQYSEVAGWIAHGDGWARLGDGERAAAMAAVDPASRAVTRWRLARLGARRQARLAGLGCAGTPREWADLLERVHADPRGMAREEAAILRRHLGWPREVSERNSERFAVFASRGGSAAGVLTEVTYALARSGRPCVVSQFYRDLPLDVWKALTRSLVHQRLVLELATGARPLDDLRAALRP